MKDRSPQPSSFVFPTALQLPQPEEPEWIQSRRDPWSWLEMFVLAQVLWGVLLFIPGSQAYRTYIRAFPYVASLVALLACGRSRGTDTLVPGARWIVAVLLLMVANLMHVETWLLSGTAQIVFQLAIAAPVFWGGRMLISPQRLQRVMLLVFGANFLSAGLGLLQVYYPSTFLPPEFSAVAIKLHPEFIESLSYVGTGDRLIIRPPGLTDMPGGAAVSGTIAAILGFELAMRAGQNRALKAAYFASAVIAITVVYLTQIRSMLLMILGCFLVIALVKLRQGKILQTGWIAASAGALVFGSFIWAVTVGGEVVQERFQGIVDAGLVTTYQENRGIMLDDTINNTVYQYPLGAGLGRWGMMSLYFGDEHNWQYPQLWAEIQPTGWIFDGGLLMWVFYPAALLVAMRHCYKLAIEPGGVLNDYATMVLTIQLFIAGLCFTGPVFNTQLGIMFWLVTAMLLGCERTLLIQQWQAGTGEVEAGESSDSEYEGQVEEAHGA